MNINKLVFWISILAVFAMAAQISVDSDTWWHLRAGKWIIEHKMVPRTDPFSYTMGGEPWEYPGWLIEVPMYWIYRVFGPGGLNLWTASMVTLTFVFVWGTLSGGPFLRAFVLVLAAATSGIYWAARPYLVTFLLAAIYLWILEKEGKQSVAYSSDISWIPSKRLWMLPLLMIIWANSHGGFAVGFVMVGIYIIGLFGRLKKLSLESSNLKPVIQHLKPLLFVVPLMILAVCLNPYGPEMLMYPFKTVGIEALQDYIQEWQSPDFRAAQVQPFVWLLLLTMGSLGVSRKRISVNDFLLVSGFAYLSLIAARNIALFAVVTPMVLTKHAQPFLQSIGRRMRIQRLHRPRNENSRRMSILNWVILIVLILVVGAKVSLIYPVSANVTMFQESLPVHAVEFLRLRNPGGRLFNSYNWGAYLLWALPEYPVFVDGRTDLYNDEIIDQWLKVVRAEDGWEEIIKQWEIQLVLLEPQLYVVKAFRDSGWSLIYQDDVSVIYEKVD